jgi:hypothetical protein
MIGRRVNPAAKKASFDFSRNAPYCQIDPTVSANTKGFFFTPKNFAQIT